MRLTKKRQIILPILAIFIGCSLSNCEENEGLKLARQKAWADTLFFAQKKELVAETDSLCNTNFEAMVEKAKDSIMAIRLKEIEKIIGQ